MNGTNNEMTGASPDEKKSTEPLLPDNFNTSVRPTWCKGCGDYGIWNSLKRAFVQLGLKSHEILMVYGIGNAGNGANFLKSYVFHSLHGRALPVATGAKLTNHKLNVIIAGGDGDGVGIGGNHFIHTCRRNLDMTYLLYDNRVYGLTTGQTSPTSDQGFKTKSTPSGVLEMPINPVLLALSAGATFVARGFAGDIKHLTEIIVEAIQHKGFSFVDILQPCVTFNKKNTYDWYKERVYKINEQAGYETDNLLLAIEKSLEPDKIPIGIFYKIIKPTYEGSLKQIKERALVDYDINNIDIDNLLKNFA